MLEVGELAVEKGSDAELVAQSLTGHREAFGCIVVRYQGLITALALSGTGSVCQSEDLAQETFLVAWRQLRGLRDPNRLRSWLCQIARHLISDFIRQRSREPLDAAASLDAVQEQTAPEPLASEQAMNREEVVLLWRSLEKIPRLYREVLVLFYRQHQSVERVAASLGLTEDAVKQRLARGRKLLTQQVAGIVERTLERTGPGRAFTRRVLSAMPTLPLLAKTTPFTVATTAGTLAKIAAAIGPWATVFWGGVLGVLGLGWLGSTAQVRDAKSPRERQFRSRFVWMGSLAALLFVGLVAGARQWALMQPSVGGEVARAGELFVCAAILVWQLAFYTRGQRQIQIADGTWNSPDKLTGASFGRLCFELSKRMAGLLGAVAILSGQAALEGQGIAAVVGFLLVPVFVLLAVWRWHRRLKRPQRPEPDFLSSRLDPDSPINATCK